MVPQGALWWHVDQANAPTLTEAVAFALARVRHRLADPGA